MEGGRVFKAGMVGLGGAGFVCVGGGAGGRLLPLNRP